MYLTKGDAEGTFQATFSSFLLTLSNEGAAPLGQIASNYKIQVYSAEYQSKFGKYSDKTH
jgi:hypothetical protein